MKLASTVVNAFNSKDGAVLASDLKVSRGDHMTNISMVKPFVMSDTGVIGYTTEELAWTNEFVEILKKTSTKSSDVARVRLAVQRYNSAILSRYPDRYPSEVDIEGILATFDKENKTPHILPLWLQSASA